MGCYLWVGGKKKLKAAVSFAGGLGCRKWSSWLRRTKNIGNTQGLLCWIWNGFVLSSISETLAQMIEENLNCLGHLSTIIREANEDQSSSMMSLDWSWLADWLVIRALFSSLWSCSSTYCGHLSCGSHSSLTSPWRRQLWSETTNDFTRTRAWCFVFK